MKKWRVGLIGNGGICKGAHLSTYLNDERLEVVAVCDIIEERNLKGRIEIWVLLSLVLCLWILRDFLISSTSPQAEMWAALSMSTAVLPEMW